MKHIKPHQKRNPWTHIKRGNKLVKKSCKENKKIESCSKICSAYTSSPLRDHCRNLCAIPEPLCGQPVSAEREAWCLPCSEGCSSLVPLPDIPGLPHHPCRGSPRQELPSQDGCLKEKQFWGCPCCRETCLRLFRQGLCSGVFSSCLNKRQSGLKNGFASQCRKTGQVEVILAHPAHLCLWNLVPLTGSGSLICSLSHWSSK